MSNLRGGKVETQTEIVLGELLVISKLNAVDVFTGKEGIEKILSDIEKQVLAFQPDTSTIKGRKEIASLAFKVSQSKVMLDDLGKGLVSEWKSKSALVDASRKIARDTLDALRDKARQPLTEWEESEEKRIEAEKLALQIETAHGEALAENDLFNRSREISRKEAELARIEADRKLKDDAELAAKLAKEAAEKAEADRLANEERIRKEAEEKAKHQAAEAIAEAERKAAEAEAAKIAAEEKAKADKLEAERLAAENQRKAVEEAERKAKEEAAKIEFDRKVAESKAAAAAEATRKEEELKSADIEHRRAVNKEVVAGLISAGLTEKQAQSIVTAIVGGMIKHTSIKY